MSLRTRIAALEQLAKSLATPASCATCGGPMPGVNRYVVCDQDRNPIDLHHGRKRIPQCPQCGLLVDDTGKAKPSATAIPPRGEIHVKRIMLYDEPSRTVPAATD